MPSDEWIIDQNWRTVSPNASLPHIPAAKHLFGWQGRVPNISAALIERAHRRYALSSTDADVAEAWSQLADSAYTLDLWGMDSGGTTHIPGTNYDNFA